MNHHPSAEKTLSYRNHTAYTVSNLVPTMHFYSPASTANIQRDKLLVTAAPGHQELLRHPYSSRGS